MSILTTIEEVALYHDAQRSGFVAVRIEGRQRWCHLSKLEAMLGSVPSAKDVGVSQGEFYKCNRSVENLARIQVAFVDLDTYDSSHLQTLSAEEQVMLLLEYCEDKQIPPPSFINSSGRGLHLKWLLTDPVPHAALRRWNTVQKCLADAFDEYGADKGARDASRCLRSVGTRNPKNGKLCRTIWVDVRATGRINRWEFETLCTEVLPVKRSVLNSQRRQRKAEQSTPVNMQPKQTNGQSPKVLWLKRLEDMRTLIQIRGWQDGVPTGCRNNFLVIAATAITWTTDPDLEKLTNAIDDFAREFCPTYSQADVRSSTRSIIRQCVDGNLRKYGDGKIIDMLKIQPYELKQLRTIIGEDLRTEHHRINCRLRQRKQDDRETYERRASQLRRHTEFRRNEGESVEEIAYMMGCSVSTVKSRLSSKTVTKADVEHANQKASRKSQLVVFDSHLIAQMLDSIVC